MITYKKFIYALNEILTPKEQHEVNTTYPEREPWIQNHLDNHLFSKGIDDIYEPLLSSEKTHTHKKIEDLLNKTLSAKNPNHAHISISKKDYKQGNYQHLIPKNPNFPNSKDKYQPRSIASALGDNFPFQLKKDYMADPSRQSKTEEGLLVRITRSKTGIAGQTSHNQSWPESCKNFNTGHFREYLPREYQHGSVVAYLHDKNGTEIARKTFHPYYNKNGNVAYKENGSYGIKHQEFENKAREIEQRLSSPHPTKDYNFVYSLNTSNHYDNLANSDIIHPNLTSDQLNQLATDHKNNPTALAFIAKHRNANKDLLDKLIHHKIAYVRKAVLENQNSDENHARIGAEDEYDLVRYAALKHKKIPPEVLSKVIDNPNSTIDEKLAAAQHKNLPKEKLDEIFNGHDNELIRSALQNPNLKSHYIEKAFSIPNQDIKYQAFNHPKAPDYIKNDNFNLLSYANKDNLHNFLYYYNHGDPKEIDRVLENPFALSYNIGKLYTHKNINPNTLDKLFNKNNLSSNEYDNSYLLNKALDNPNIKSHHIESIFKHSNDLDLLRKAFQHYATPDHIKNNPFKQINYGSIEDVKKVLDSGNSIAINSLIDNPYADMYHKKLAVRHKNFNNLDELFSDNGDPTLMTSGLYNPNIKQKHLNYAKLHGNEITKNRAEEREKELGYNN